MARSLYALLLVTLAWVGSGSPQPVRGRLPLEPFTAAQGIASDSVTTVFTDSRGFVWFGTLDGLSRYDGNRFVNYTTDDGLPGRMVWSVAEDRRGGMWVATPEGVAQMTSAATRGRTLFTPVPTPAGQPVEAGVVFVDRRGAIWSACGADLCIAKDGRLQVDASFRRAGGRDARAIIDTASGELWVGTGYGLLRRMPDGAWRRYAVHPHRGIDIVHGLLFDNDGRLWVSTGFEVLIYGFTADDRDERSFFERSGKALEPEMALRLPSPGEVVAITPGDAVIVHCREPFLARDGVVWVPTFVGLLRIGEGTIQLYDHDDGLPRLDILSVGQDPAGDLWIGTRGAGVLRFAHSGARTYTREHGLHNEQIASLFSLDDGAVCATTNRAGFSCFRDGVVQRSSFVPPGTRITGWGWNQIVVRDRTGSWWFPTGEGLVRWPPVRRIEDLQRVRPMAVYTKRDGLDRDDIFRVWQDSRGGLWVSTLGGEKPSSRGDPATGRFVSFGEAEGFLGAAPSAFAEDRAGQVWIGFYSGSLVRVSDGGRSERITAGVPPGMVRDLKIDSKGRLWIGTTDGVARIDDPTRDAKNLAIRRVTRADGLTSESGYCIVEMADGRMAIGSQRGVDILDLERRSAVHLSTRDGLASNEARVAMVDRRGALWVGTVNGLSRFSRIPRRGFIPIPQPRIHTIDIDGVPSPVPELGAAAISGVRLEYPRHAMAVGFSASDYDRGRALRFEYRLAGDEKWTDAGSQRAIVFDRLPGGAGRLEIRAATADGRRSVPAHVSFTVIPPLWKRTWFIALSVLMAMALAFIAHRSRVAHLVALERVRTQVATDLHDDLGSSLSRISILSEAAKRKRDLADSGPILDEIASSARGLVDVLGDSIWSIDPRRDDVQSLLLRIRQFAASVFEAQSIAIDVRFSPEVAALPLRPEQRRELYLILKEALNNAAKHADASRVSVVASTANRCLHIAVNDDGRGFPATAGHCHHDGHRGVSSMSERARRVGGNVEIASSAGRGTNVSIAIPL